MRTAEEPLETLTTATPSDAGRREHAMEEFVSASLVTPVRRVRRKILAACPPVRRRLA